jgi:hypothetical protein
MKVLVNQDTGKKSEPRIQFMASSIFTGRVDDFARS